MSHFARSMLIWMILAGAALFASPAVAQPDGTYLDSCRDVQMYRPQRPDGLLLAECRNRRGNWVVTSLRYKTCRGDITNNDGNLTCGEDAASLPGGSWNATCRNPYVQGRFLYAECRTTTGRWQEATLDLRTCPRGPVTNQNGRLVCGGEGQTGSRLTLYADADFSGDALQLTGAVPDLRDYDFNDLASSIRVQGTWYVCTDINFRGECSPVAGAFNLKSKWNNRISSVRPGAGQ